MTSQASAIMSRVLTFLCVWSLDQNRLEPSLTETTINSPRKKNKTRRYDTGGVLLFENKDSKNVIIVAGDIYRCAKIDEHDRQVRDSLRTIPS